MKTKKEVLQGMLDKNTLLIEGKIAGDTVEYVASALAQLTSRSSPELTLYIMSGGGSVRAGLDIYDMLSVYPSKITGIVAAFAKSMAVIILQACDKRLAMAHSRVLIHHISTSEVTLDVLRSPRQIRKLREDMENEQRYLDKILSNRTGKTSQEIRKQCRENRDMLVEEALAFGLIDGIVPMRERTRSGAGISIT